MNQHYHIPDNADRATLAAIHNEILAHNPSIRPVNRWGAFTEYSITLKRREVVDLIGVIPEGDERVWRLVVGVERDEEGTIQTIDVQYYDREQHLWESALSDRAGEADPVVDRATLWLGQHHPASEALARIDGLLLAMDGEAE